MSIGIAIGLHLGRTLNPAAAAETFGALAPDDVATPLVWLAAEDLVLNDDDPVSTWASSVGALSAVGSLTERPLYKTAIFPNGKPAVRWDSTNDIMSVTGLNLAPYSAVTIVLVTAAVASTAAAFTMLEYGELYTGDPAGQLHIGRLSGLTVAISSKNGAAGAVADFTTWGTSAVDRMLVTTFPRIITCTFDKSVQVKQGTAWINGVFGGGWAGSGTGRTNDNDSGSAFAASQPLYIGARNATGVPTQHIGMDLGCLLIYGRKLTQRELARLHMWLDDQYDIYS